SSSRGRLVSPVASNESVRRAVVAEPGLHWALELRDDALRQHLSQLHAPLVERIDVPDDALREHAVLVERDQLAQRPRGQPVGEDRVRGTVSLEHAVGDERLRRALCNDLLARLAEGQCLGLSEYIREQHVVVTAERVERLRKRDEVARDETGSLMDELI